MQLVKCLSLYISDTSPLTNLIQIGKLEIIKLVFQHVIIPPVVDVEIRALANFGIDLTEYLNAKWIEVVVPSDEHLLKQMKEDMDEGEAEAIVIH